MTLLVRWTLALSSISKQELVRHQEICHQLGLLAGSSKENHLRDEDSLLTGWYRETNAKISFMANPCMPIAYIVY